MDCECDHCHYCGNWLGPHHEHDHYPVPRALGGTATVPTCRSCHDLLDRTPLRDWPLGLIGAAAASLSPQIRQAVVKGDLDALVLPPLADGEACRLLVAKIRRVLAVRASRGRAGGTGWGTAGGDR